MNEVKSHFEEVLTLFIIIGLSMGDPDVCS